MNDSIILPVAEAQAVLNCERDHLHGSNYIQHFIRHLPGHEPEAVVMFPAYWAHEGRIDESLSGG